MHRHPLPSSCFPFCPDRPDNSRGWMFAELIRDLRRARRLSIEEAAELAGMEYSEWAAIESGHLPIDFERLRPLAAVLQVDWEELSRLP